MKTHAQFIIICREAFLEAGTNNLNLIRIFTQVHASSFPHVLPPFALVVNFDVDTAGVHTLRTVVLGPDGKQIAQTELPVTTTAGNWQVIANFEQLQAPAAGTFTFRIALDGEPLGERTLEVRPTTAPKTTAKPPLPSMEEKASPLERQLPNPRAPIDVHAAYFDVHPEDITSAYLNNLYLYLPDSDYRKMTSTYVTPERQAFLDVLDATTAELSTLADGLRRVEEERQQLRQKADVVGERLKTVMAELRDLPEEERRTRFQSEAMPLVKEQSKLAGEANTPQKTNEALVPLYQALRAKGYTHQDIVS